MKTAREIVKEWRPGCSSLAWTLRIPAGTPVEIESEGSGFDSCGIAALPSMLIDAASRVVAERPGSLFKHDATHYFVWANLEDCE